MLGQAMSMLIPRVVGFKLGGELPEGATATDLVLTVTQMLREHGVVGKFVEFYGAGRPEPAAGRPRDDRQHEPGVRLDLRDLPDRRRDAALPRVHRPHGRADRDRRGLRPRAGPVARRGHRGADLLRDARARPRRRRPVARRPEAPAGPRLADRGQVGLPRRARGHPARAGADDRGADVDEEVDGVLPGLRPAGHNGNGSRPRRLARRPRTARASQVAERVEHAVAADAGGRHARPSSTTATW